MSAALPQSAPIPRPTVALFAKFPRAGEVKTRLIPAVGAQQAAAIHRHLVERTITVILASGIPFMLYTSGAPLADFTDWLGPDVKLREQGEGDLGARLSRVPAPTILLGADLPDLTALHLKAAEACLLQSRVVIGPAVDGGYYLLGYQEPMPFLFDDMAWGTGGVCEETQRRLAARGIEWMTLAEMADCDRPEDLARWPDLAR